MNGDNIMTDKKKIAFIGSGNMAGAIISGILKNNIMSPDSVSVYDIDSDKLNRFSELGLKTYTDVKKMVEDNDFIFLSIKPQQFEEVLDSIKNAISDRHVIVTIAAGISSSYIKKKIGFDCKIIRAMPNTPLLIGFGATALTNIYPTTTDEYNFIEKIFESSGVVCRINEDKMNEVIAVNGSTPAFIYLYSKYFIEEAIRRGVDKEAAIKLFTGTLIGSAKMITDSGFTIDELIEMVSSKGGTTLKGLEALVSNNLETTVVKAVEASVARAYELEK